MLWLLLPIVLAADLHGGIPVHGVGGLGPPQFQTLENGWSADISGGRVRVFVGPTEVEASAWLQRQREGQPSGPATVDNFADEAFGNGTTYFAFRDANVGVVIESLPVAEWVPTNLSNARTWAKRMQKAIAEEQPWPDPPVLRPIDDGKWIVHAPESVHLSFEGGRVELNAGPVFTVRPNKVIAWDALGRPAVLDLQSDP